MDPYEATKIVFSRIQKLDPENASKIMGLLLIQDHGEKEMIRLAFGPENLLHSLIFKAKQELGISPNTPSTPSTPSTTRQSSMLFLPNGLKIPSSLSVSSLASPSSSSSSPSWATSNFPDFQNPDGFTSPNSHTDQNLIDEMNYLQEQLSYLGEDTSSLGATWGPHCRSCSVNDISMKSDDDSAAGGGGGGLAWKNCMYFSRGFCKNGSGCRFLHDGLGDSNQGSFVGWPSKIEMMEQCQELLRSKSLQHQRLIAANNANSPHYSGSKLFNLLVQQQQNESRRSAAAMLMGEDIHKFSRSRLSRSDHMMNGGGQMEWSLSSRQIYLTFPADSTFREEDVSNYFWFKSQFIRVFIKLVLGFVSVRTTQGCC